MIVAVLVVAAGGAGAWWFWLSDDTAADVGFATGTETQLTRTLEERYPKDWKPDASTTQMSIGSWLDGRWWTEQHFVREMWHEIVAYDLADGSVAWRVPVEGNGACRASREVSPEGYVAVLRGKPAGVKGGPKPCDQLTIVDINAGKEIWTSAIQPGVASVLPDARDVPVIWGETVYIPNQGQTYFELGTGTQKEIKDRDCWVSDFAVFGDTLIAWQCRALVAYDRDGEKLWAWPYPGKDKTSLAVLSVDPLVVAVGSRSDEQVWRVTPGEQDDPGEHTVVIELDSTNLDPMPPCGRSGGTSAKLNRCDKVVVDAGVLYLKYAMDPNYRQMGIVAFDVESGEELWRAKANGGLSLQPIDVDGDGRLIAFQPQGRPASDDAAARAAVVAIEAKTGDITPLASLPRVDTAKLKWLLANNSLDGEIEWRDDRLVIATPGPIVAEQSAGGGPESLATLVYS